MLLIACSERLHRNPGGARQHERRAGRKLPDTRSAGRHRRHAIDTRTAWSHLESNAFFFVIALALGDDLTEDTITGEPAELHVDRGTIRRVRGNRDQARCCR